MLATVQLPWMTVGDIAGIFALGMVAGAVLVITVWFSYVLGGGR